MTAVSRCRSCDAPIRWVKTVSGKAMPLDSEPVTLDASTTAPRLYHADGKAARADAWGWAYGYRPHWATCPTAKEHRRERDGEGAR